MARVAPGKTTDVLLGTRTKVLGFDASAAKEARRAVGEALVSFGLDHAVTPAQLCTTELVNEALLSGESPLVLVMAHWTDCVQVTLIDGAKEYDRRADVGPYAESRIRTRIVEGTASNWGRSAVPAGMAAWFDVDTHGGPDGSSLLEQGS